MRPILFRCFGMPLYSYPAMLYLGLFFGITAENYVANLRHLNSSSIFFATLILLVPALAGARILFLISNWKIYKRHPSRIWSRSEGGASMYGGLPLCLLASVPLLKMMELSFWAFWDVATFAILIGMIFTRFGCLLNGCCVGSPTTRWFGLRLPNTAGVWTRRVPSPLLEAGCGIVLFIGALLVSSSHPFPGTIFLFTSIAYGAARFMFERTRESQDRLSNLRIHIVISAILVCISLIIFFILQLRWEG